jgi:hypothetical protein
MTEGPEQEVQQVGHDNLNARLSVRNRLERSDRAVHSPSLIATFDPSDSSVNARRRRFGGFHFEMPISFCNGECPSDVAAPSKVQGERSVFRANGLSGELEW